MATPVIRTTPAEVAGRYDIECPDGRQLLDLTVEEIASLAKANRWNVFFAGQYVGYFGRWSGEYENTPDGPKQTRPDPIIGE